jgi:hypothetical protein
LEKILIIEEKLIVVLEGILNILERIIFDYIRKGTSEIRITYNYIEIEGVDEPI